MNFYDQYLHTSTNKINLCVGIDPTKEVLNAWGLDNSANGALEFSRTILLAAQDLATVVKPQIAYFERFGPDGFRVLASIISEARERGFLVIADIKRGDIGSTVDAYAEAWLGDKAAFPAHAITANPYLGFNSLEPMLARAADTDAYVFVVARSSNPEGASIQMHGTPPLWHNLLDEMLTWNEIHNKHTVGAVVGATVATDLEHALTKLPDAIFLAPGIGRQGATTESFLSTNSAADRILFSASRSIAECGPSVELLQNAIKLVQGKS